MAVLRCEFRSCGGGVRLNSKAESFEPLINNFPAQFKDPDEFVGLIMIIA